MLQYSFFIFLYPNTVCFCKLRLQLRLRIKRSGHFEQMKHEIVQTGHLDSLWKTRIFFTTLKKKNRMISVPSAHNSLSFTEI